MTRAPLVLAIDQGTSSTRTILYDRSLRPLARADRRLQLTTPRSGWVEQSPDAILESVVDTVATVLALVPQDSVIAAVGLANQGETVVAWDRLTGQALAPAVSWRCRRSESIMARLAPAHGDAVREITGLPMDAYYSAGKMTWLLEQVPEVAHAAAEGRLRLGTVDAWLLDRLSGEALTDPGTASRTQLMNLRTLAWDPWLTGIFGVPQGCLPQIVPSTGLAATIGHPRWPMSLPLMAMACDQQAALVGHAGLKPGAVKATYGTGVFVVADTGATVQCSPGLETSVNWQLGDGTVNYMLQGGVLSAASLLDWLGANLGLPSQPDRLAALAASVPDAGGVSILPALNGLGAPWYQATARAVIAGLTSATTPAHIARAALDSIAHATCDIVDALETGTGRRPELLRVDGGLSNLGVLMQRQSDLLGMPVAIAQDPEATARGVALLAAVGAGILSPDDDLALAPREALSPVVDAATRMTERATWRRFVEVASAL